jgi:hypothetical protein
MKNIYKLGLVSFASIVLSTTLQAKQCFNQTGIDVQWTSYKTLAKIGVSGHFNDVKLMIKNKNASNIKSFLNNARVSIKLSSIDANNENKTKSIKKYFVSNLSSKMIDAKIVSVEDKDLRVKIDLNGVSKIIPMKYTMAKGIIVADGVIDGEDFKLQNALKVLNTNVIPHANKGWYDIPIKFNMNISKNCM